jgi:hypothetical protein
MGICPSKDMAIGIVIFNPAKSKKLIANYHEMMKHIDKYPVFTLELVYPGCEPELPSAIHIRGKSVMFHKENLCRILETYIPLQFKKLAFLDADLIFEDDWYEKASRALEYNQVVQLFSTCQWLDQNREVMLERKSVLKMREPDWNSSYHPGFAWGFQREWYNRVGFFDYAVSGSGDTLSAMQWLQKRIPRHFKSLPPPVRKRYAVYCPKPPRISCIDGTVQHLFHGSRENRQYTERHKMLDIDADIDDLLELKNGLFEWKDESKNAIFLKYFLSRNDDDILTS